MHKNDSQVVNLFMFLGFAHAKAACRKLMKLTPGCKNSHVGKIFRVIFRQADSSNSSIVDVDLGGDSQNFLGKFIRFFVTLSYF
jgi:hypothetical protein